MKKERNMLEKVIKLLIACVLFLFSTLTTKQYQFSLYPIMWSILPWMIYVITSYDKEHIVHDKLVILTSAIFGCVFAIGKEYNVNDLFLLNLSIFNVLILVAQACIISYCCYLTIGKILTYEKQETKQIKLEKIFKNCNLYKLMGILFISWIPYMVLMYPCLLQIDSAIQLAQFLKLDNIITSGVKLINENQLITSHHSVLYTYILGIFSKFININIGLYIFNILQTIFIIFTISKMFLFVRTRTTNKKLLSIMFLFICIFPLFPFVLTTLGKDTLFFGIFILFAIELYKVLNHEKYNKIIFYTTLCLAILLRNNFKYAIFVFLIFALIKKYHFAKSAIILVILTSFTYTGCCKMLDITPGSKSEMYAIPILQVSKCTIEYKDELTKEEIKIIDAVLDYDKIEELFDAKNVDALKNTYAERKPSDNEVKNFFKLWIKLGLRHPVTYLESFLNKTIGYFYQLDPSILIHRIYYRVRNDLMIYKYADNLQLQISKFGFKPNKTIMHISENVDKVFAIIFNIPIIGLLTIAPTYVWFMIFTLMICTRKKDKNNIYYILFLILYLGTLLLGPVDGMYEFRYVYPIVSSVPLFLLMSEKNKI